MESPGKIELPSAFEHADIDHLVVLIADMLDRLIEHNDKIPLSPEALTRFHSRTPPSISVIEYLRRIVKYANVERTCLLITLHYIDQICARLTHFTLSSLTCHRFIIAAIVVASKALCDAFCTNAHYAKVGGIRVGELNVLEKELLSAIDWRLTSTREVLDAYYVNLIRTHSKGAYTIAPEVTSPTLSSADSDMDSLLSTSPEPSGVILEDEAQKATNAPSRSIEPQAAPVPVSAVGATNTGIEPSTVLLDRATLSPKPSTGPTLEQNMAFEDLRKASASTTVASMETDADVTAAVIDTDECTMSSTKRPLSNHVIPPPTTPFAQSQSPNWTSNSNSNSKNSNSNSNSASSGCSSRWTRDSPRSQKRNADRANNENVDFGSEVPDGNGNGNGGDANKDGEGRPRTRMRLEVEVEGQA